MTRRRPSFLAFGTLITLALALIAAISWATPLDTNSEDWEGLGDFVALSKQELGPSQVVVSTDLDYSQLKREDSVLLIHPEKTLDTESLARFMHDGGRVVLLDDYGTGDELLRHFGIERTAAPRAPAQMLRHNPSLAIAVPASDPPHASAQGVQRVVTNHPTGLRHPSLTPVLSIPQEDGDITLLALAGAVAQGRLLVVGDSSLVMNSMLRYPGNKAFARGLVHYAMEDDSWGKRGGRLYILVGGFGQTGTYGQDEEDALGAKWRALVDVLRTVEKEGVSPTVALALAAIVGLGIVLWIGSRAGKLHRPTAPRYVQPIPLAAQGGVAGHAAVIAAPGTSRVLALLEVKSSLEEELSLLCGLEKTPGHEVLLRVVAEKGLLSREGLIELRALFLRLSNVETLVMSRRAQALKGVRDAEVLVVARTVRKVMQEARASVQRVA
jgi:hypothetical protein